MRHDVLVRGLYGNFHEMVLTGGGLDLTTGTRPIFQRQRLDIEVNLSGPLQQVAQDYISSMRYLSIKTLLVQVLRHLEWRRHLSASGTTHWPRVFNAGHSQGSSPRHMQRTAAPSWVP